MSFFVQFADTLALFLVFFGLMFFVLRRFFFWFFAISERQERLIRIEKTQEQIKAQLTQVQEQIRQLAEQVPTLDSANTERLRNLVQSELTPNPPLVKRDLAQDFRPFNPKVKAQVQARIERGECAYCGQPAAASFCDLQHEKAYFSGNYPEPLNLPNSSEDY
ncbi:MAG: hypothetical protein A2527_08765 [Candidatus Lambdaproteobacteria bacterium RIFOXYD2_FULL_50_16]|uniref:Uncharacterized protein n=1 Tax=Candidatus Lambdaproteobacteria bacterium RIFOXYD2_FULL_50_16 TaxID=1817772 RepID=A0A1F6GAV8_9PROT|nr:MAG: hypothetical protein A2527_08765 [Candidatus Lambdaproteobacteria bacterium RIFOXYD2_FULL_50_16]